MFRKTRPLKKIFIQQMILSALIELIVLVGLFVIVKNDRLHERRAVLLETLTIQGSFGQQELIRARLFKNTANFDLTLHNFADERRLDSLSFVRTLDKKALGDCFYHTHEGYRLCQGRGGIFWGVTPLVDVDGRIHGYLIARKTYDFTGISMYHGMVAILITVLSIFLCNLAILFFWIQRRVEGNTRALLDFIRTNPNRKQAIPTSIKEYQLIGQQFLNEREKIKQLEKEKARHDAYRQLVHDIKSPLSTLRAVITRAPLQDARWQVIQEAIQRLMTMATEFISPSREGQMAYTETRQREPLYLIIDSVLLEKHYEYQDKPITIQFEGDAFILMSFAMVDADELKRVLSNIINNAVEAIPGKGSIRVELAQLGDQVAIHVHDNGIGIPQDQQERITNEGVSIGKPNGAGLGLFDAKTKLEAWGGALLIRSSVGQGTTVTLQLPRSEVPLWFCEGLAFEKEKRKETKETEKTEETVSVVVLDDRDDTHEEWASILAPYSKDLHLRHYHTVDTILNEAEDVTSVDLFLVDYDLRHEKTGLDVITALAANKKSVLVTNNDRSHDIRTRCIELGIKLLPKSLMPHIPIEIRIKNADSTVILIDDDPLVHSTWALAAISEKIELKTFASSQAFEEIIHALDKDTPIYLDSNLGEGLTGEQYAEQLYRQGFKALYLTTGFQKNHFGTLPWIKDIIDKTPPFGGSKR